MKRFLVWFLILAQALPVGAWPRNGDNFLGVPLTPSALTDGYVWTYSSATGKYVLSPSGGSATPDASMTVKGVTELDTSPAVASNPIAVGTNSVRMPPTPATNGGVVIDTGAAYTITAQGAANTLLHGVGSGAPTWSALVNADVAAGAAIVYSKLNLAASIVAGDLAAALAARIPPTPATNGGVVIDTGAAYTITAQGAANTLLHGVGSGAPTWSALVNADVAAGAAIVYSKLNLAASIVNADVAVGAAIAYSKLNLAASIVIGDLATALANRVNSATATNGGLVYGNGTNYSTSAAGTAGQTLQSAGAASPVWVDPIVPTKNAILNPEFMVAQRTTPVATIADGAYSLDRWRYNKVGAAVHTASQSTTVPTFGQAGRATQNSILLALTTADTSIASTDLVTLSQPIEGYRWIHFDQKPLVLTFWVSSPITGVHCVALRNSGNDRSCVIEYTVSAANTWEFKTVAFPASPGPSAGTWNYTTGVGALLSFTLAAGTNFNTTAGSYQTGNFCSTANQVNAVNTGLTNFRLAMVELAAGTTATAFESIPFSEQKDMCQRYYYQLGQDNTNTVVGSGFCTSSTDARISLVLPVAMRATPTVSVSTAGDWAVYSATGTVVACTGISTLVATKDTIGLTITTGGSLASGSGTLMLGNSANARLMLSSEL